MADEATSLKNVHEIVASPFGDVGGRSQLLDIEFLVMEGYHFLEEDVAKRFH
jgi:hypothetical protein